MDDDIDDTHLCIKCSATIVGLENYIKHRSKQNCRRNLNATTSIARKEDHPNVSLASGQHSAGGQHTPAITYEPFNFNETETPLPSGHGGKTSKNLGDNYDLAYELGADVFFSSLQLQSVQSSVGGQVPSQSGGKTGVPSSLLPREKSEQREQTAQEEIESWEENQTARGSQLNSSSDNLLKAVNAMGEGKKAYDSIFKPLAFGQDTPDMSPDEEDEVDDVDEDMDDDDEDYDPLADANATGGKWKLPLSRHSPPVVPASHTGGKWKPENRPNVRMAQSSISMLSPNWEDQPDDVEASDGGQHPPSDHTKGKWIPGTKMQRLEYKEEEELAKLPPKQDYWCNICCRKLKSKLIYENHLKSTYHMKRSEPETQLEKAVLSEMPKEIISKSFALEANKLKPKLSNVGNKRKRRSAYLKCLLCKYTMSRHLIGKHLISHYHYRRMQINPSLSLPLILENIHHIVMQSPFQCRPCHFYANTEEMFLLHWNSASHKDLSEGPGRFWCSYCHYECEDNNQMRRHLLGPEHKEVLLAINRSVPICITKRLRIICPKCAIVFRYNFELIRHLRQLHPGVECFGTASDAYQSRFRCLVCPEILQSKIALQRHEKFKHLISKYFCSICCIEFNSPCQARRHRKTLNHKQRSQGGGEIKKENKQKVEQVKEKEEVKAIEVKKEVKKIETIVLPKVEIATATTEDTAASSNTVFEFINLQEEKPCTSKEAKKRNRLHKKSSKISKTKKCCDCPETFKSREDLKKHREQKHFLSQCMSCGEKFVTAQELGQHSRRCKPKTNVEPTKAGIDNVASKAIAGSESLHKCDLCNFSASFESEIIYHRLFHKYGSVGKNLLIKCPLCEKSFRKHSLRCHLRQHTNEKIFECDICDAKFSRAHNLKDHKEKVHDKKEKKKVMPTKEANEKVEKTSTAKELIKCDSCDKVFKRKYTLKMHCLTQHVTKPERRFMCPHENCDYGTANSSLLKVHLASHSIESFQCPQKGCGYAGKSLLHLKRHHQQKHIPSSSSDVKRYACKQCKFQTKIKGHLARHMRSHTGEKPYKCPYCDFCTNVSENLRKHILKTGRHPGKYVYECKLCEAEIKKNKNSSSRSTMAGEEIFKTNSHSEYQRHCINMHSNRLTTTTTTISLVGEATGTSN